MNKIPSIDLQDFEKRNSMKKVFVIKVYTENCPPCKLVNLTFSHVVEIKKDQLDFFQFDITEEVDLFAKLAVKELPCFILFTCGVEQSRFYGCSSKRNIIDWIERHVSPL